MGESNHEGEASDFLVSSLPATTANRLKLMFLGCVVIFGGISGGYQLGGYFKGQYETKAGLFRPRPQFRLSPKIPTSVQPGPKRADDDSFDFLLDEENSLCMTGVDDPKNERWCDIGDNYYTRRFVAGYSNGGTAAHRPVVRIRIEPEGPTLKGRLEATGLKPSFAYQIKLKGDFNDRAGFEAIGGMGRWRLPGDGTNYTDADYESYPEEDKHQVEAYVLFDYFVTDEAGAAVREFKLDSSLHVLWRTDQDATGIEENTVTLFKVRFSNSAIYSTPAYATKVVGIWAERERKRYETVDQAILLPPHAYQASLVLTEESFHSEATDGGFWATVFSAPIQFTIVKESP